MDSLRPLPVILAEHVFLSSDGQLFLNRGPDAVTAQLSYLAAYASKKHNLGVLPRRKFQDHSFDNTALFCHHPIIGFRASGVGAGSNPATVLVLIVLLLTCCIIDWCGQQLKEENMKNKHENSRELKSENRAVKRRITKLAGPVTCIFNVVWAFGVSTVAAMATPLLTH